MTSSVSESTAVSAVADPAMTLDAGMVAHMLGLSPEAFMRGVQRGMIVQRTERGVDEDEAGTASPFRFRRRRCRIRFNSDTAARSYPPEPVLVNPT